MKPYIKKLLTIKKITVWQVDGNYVRNKISIDFTNSGHHYTFDKIPNNEVWIDKDFSKHCNVSVCSNKTKCVTMSEEEELLILQAMIERRLMKQKIPYAKALMYSAHMAKNHRKLLNDIPLEKTYNKVYINKLKKYCTNNVKVWLVNGRLIRDNFYIHFTEGGHHYVYKFVPSNEIWIDDCLNPKEYGYVLFHEAIERNLMKYNKMKYSDAHDVAIKYEGIIRSKHVNPDELIYHELNRKE